MVVLVDTSVWIDHLHRTDAELVGFLDAGLVVQHPMVTAELALGSLSDRARVLGLLNQLRSVLHARHDEVLTMVEQHALHGRGLGYVDAHVLASTLLTPDCALWTRDKRLGAAAGRLGVRASMTGSP